MRGVLVLFGAVLMMLPASSSMAQERPFTLVARGTLNTSGRLFPNPGSADPVARAKANSYTDFFGLGAELQYHFPGSNISLSVSADYIRNSGSTAIASSGPWTVEVEDYYTVIPVEVTGYFRIPVTDGPFSIFMGGGVGGYWGTRHYAVAGTVAPTTSVRGGYGIHVLSGVGYRVNEWFSVSAEVKFRDAQFQTTNAFRVATAKRGTIVVSLPQQPLESRIHSDGMVVQVGLGVSF